LRVLLEETAMLPNLKDLQIFMAIAEDLSFRRAAERLFMDQSALSRRLQALEETVGFPLIFRTTRAVQLTEAGRILYERMAPLIRGIGQATQAARSAATGQTGSLRIAYMSFAAMDGLPVMIQRYASAFPDVAIELRHMPTQAQKLALSRGEIDAGFMLGPFQNADFRQRSIQSERLVAIMAPHHVLAQREVVTLADLSGQKMILGFEQWDFFRQLLDAIFTARGLTLHPSYEPSDALGIFGLVMAGLGVSLYVESISRFRPDGLIVRPIADCDDRIETLLCWSRSNGNPALRRFVEMA
jgi:LysR family transcriptional regulator, benzoate and cis,cis-muconate-responsive activator of ben and cat genes